MRNWKRKDCINVFVDCQVNILSLPQRTILAKKLVGEPHILIKHGEVTMAMDKVRFECKSRLNEKLT